MSRARDIAALTAPLLWTAFVALPVDGWGILDGAPLGPLDAVALTVVWSVFAATGRVPGGRLIAGALLLKLASAPLLLPQGFSASYFANDAFAPPIEPSVEYRRPDATRVDRELAFGGAGSPDFPLFFFDDFTRFNFYRRGEPRRYELPFSVIWDGYEWVQNGDRERVFYLKGSGVTATLEIDGATAASLAAGAGAVTVPVSYPKGWRHVVVRVAAGSGTARAFEAGTLDAASREHALGSATLYRAPATPIRVRLDRGIRFVGGVIDVAAIAALTVFAVMAARGRRIAALLIAFVTVDALWFASPAIGRLILQPGGDDSLTYQTYARDIALHGPWQLLGAPMGQGEPFYYQPLYSYFLAAVHLLSGDGLFGLYYLQRLSLAVILGCIWWMTRRLYARRAGDVALVLGAAFLYGWVSHGNVDPWARTLWTEVLFVPLVCAWTCGLIALCSRDAAAGTAVLAGLAAGAAVLTRSTLLVAVALAPLPVIYERRKAQLPLSPVAVMIAVTIAMAGLATTRNWMVSGRFVPITTSLAVNLHLGNTPPAGLPDDKHWWSGLIAEDSTRQVIEYARHEPRAFARNLWNKTLYSFGYFERLVPGAGYSIIFIALWMVAVTGAASTLRSMPGSAVHWIPGLVAACHFLTVILIFPSHFRLIMPGYVLLLPYVAALGRNSK